LFQPPKVELLLNQDEVVYLQPSWNDLNLTPAQKFYEISRKLDRIAENCSKVQYVVMPESSFGYDLMEWSDKIVAWTSLFSPTVSILVGAHRKQGSCTYNSLCHIQDGKIIEWYDKQHLVFFAERQPKLFKNWPILSDLFISYEFSYPEQDQSHLDFAGLQPAICSEIFCGMRKFKHGSPIIFVCHDAWFDCAYAHQLGRNAVQLCAMRYGVPIIYVGSYDWDIIV